MGRTNEPRKNYLLLLTLLQSPNEGFLRDKGVGGRGNIIHAVAATKFKLSLRPLRAWGSRHQQTTGRLVRCVGFLEWQDQRCFNLNLTILDFEAIKRTKCASPMILLDLGLPLQ